MKIHPKIHVHEKNSVGMQQGFISCGMPANISLNAGFAHGVSKELPSRRTGDTPGNFTLWGNRTAGVMAVG
ncbi:MAG: hypothetical protein NC347_07980 [Clostridium sp.]|nr:hypothetical protein [Clostridium sp.]